jgi:hypothetical protein
MEHFLPKRRNKFVVLRGVITKKPIFEVEYNEENQKNLTEDSILQLKRGESEI